MLLGRDVMFSYPQYLDFAYNDKTSETCQFLLGMLQRKSEVLYLHSRQVANYSIATAAKLGLTTEDYGIVVSKKHPQLQAALDNSRVLEPEP